MLNSSQAIKPVWQTPFRPFFLLGALFSCLVLVLWVAQLSGFVQLNTYGPALSWHAHEMLFGFTMAIVVGFLLTAVRNWTGHKSAQGPALKMLVLLWCLSRLLWLFSDSPAWLVALCDGALPLYAGYWMAKPLLELESKLGSKSGQKHNWWFVVVLLALGVSQFIYHGVMAYRPQLLSTLHYSLVLVMSNLVFWIGGRVLPFFVQSKLQMPRRVIPIWLTPAAMTSSWSLIVLMLLQDIMPEQLLPSVAIIASVLHGYRLSLYFRKGVIKDSMLWSLFIAPCWIILGLLALAFDSLNWLHLITVGGLGGMILSMISRVSLGHSGEPIKALKWIPVAFVFMSLASLIRFFALEVQIFQGAGFTLSALLWVSAFSVFLLHYTPRLLNKRKDGLAG